MNLKKYRKMEIEGFDIDSFLEANPDLKSIKYLLGFFRSSMVFLELEKGRRRFHPEYVPFREDLYLEKFPDVKQAVESGQIRSAYDHFRRHGYREIVEGRRPWVLARDRLDSSDNDFSTSIRKTLESMQLSPDTFSSLDFQRIRELNPLVSHLDDSELSRALLQEDSTDGLLRLSREREHDAEFYLSLAKGFLFRGEKEKAKNLLDYSIYLHPLPETLELVGNYYYDLQLNQAAITYYTYAVRLDSKYKSFWLYLNLSKSYSKNFRKEEAIESLLDGLNLFPLHHAMLSRLDDEIADYWKIEEERLKERAKIEDRHLYLRQVGKVTDRISASYRKLFSWQRTNGESQSPSTDSIERVLIVGDYSIPQCIRYRIEQKVEQLEHAGYEVTAIPWTELQENYDEIYFHDAIIYYRTPALPTVVRSIEHAKALGKITFYEIDDVIFDPVYPPPYESYGGNISIQEYGGLTFGMPLFHHCARLCDYGIGSTQPIVSMLGELVSSGKAFLHRNGLDRHNLFLEHIGDKDYINLFYGSGTLAHNQDFLELALPAIEKILEKYKKACLTIVGHLTLPESFLRRFEDRVTLVEKTQNIELYWHYLRGADINLAVLHSDPINDAKSELKWFEAACFRIPSVVSDTRNYLDVIRDGEDALIASTPDEWYRAMKKLVDDADLRRAIGERAYARIREEYSVEALTENISRIFDSVLEREEEKNEE